MVQPYAYIKDVFWFHKPNRVEVYLTDKLPPVALISAAFVFAFDTHKNLLLTDVITRGWDIPGGGIEPGESPESGARREIMEEAGANVGPLRLIGFKKLIHGGPRPEGYKRQHPISYQVFYAARLSSLSENYQGDHETRGRKLYARPDLLALETIQFEFNHLFYDAALSQLETL